jgi:hypothetical protein
LWGYQTKIIYLKKNSIMKNRFILLITAFILITSASYAKGNGANIPESVVSEFNGQFSQVHDVSWEQVDGYYKVGFNQFGNKLFAFYDESDGLIGTARYLLSDALPAGLKSDLKKNYGDYWISDLIKYTIGEQSGYSVTLEKADQTITLRSNADRKWFVYKTIAK